MILLASGVITGWPASQILRYLGLRWLGVSWAEPACCAGPGSGRTELKQEEVEGV